MDRHAIKSAHSSRTRNLNAGAGVCDFLREIWAFERSRAAAGLAVVSVAVLDLAIVVGDVGA